MYQNSKQTSPGDILVHAHLTASKLELTFLVFFMFSFSRRKCSISTTSITFLQVHAHIWSAKYPRKSHTTMDKHEIIQYKHITQNQLMHKHIVTTYMRVYIPVARLLPITIADEDISSSYFDPFPSQSPSPIYA